MQNDPIYSRSSTYGSSIGSQEMARFMSKVYGWMAAGIGLTALVAYYASNSEGFMATLIENRSLFYGLMIAEVLCVLGLGMLMNRISAFAASVGYFFYAALSGTTLSVIFLAYTQQSITEAFILTGASFAGLSAFGYLTKRDLGPVGSFCTMGLFGLIGYGLLTMFFPSMYSSQGQKISASLGVLIFAGLTAYDTQKIKSLYVSGSMDSEDGKKQAIFGALKLYLDFINLFLELLSLFGKRK